MSDPGFGQPFSPRSMRSRILSMPGVCGKVAFSADRSLTGLQEALFQVLLDGKG